MVLVIQGLAIGGFNIGLLVVSTKALIVIGIFVVVGTATYYLAKSLYEKQKAA